MPIRFIVVDEERYHFLAWVSGDDLQVLIESGGVLCKVQKQWTPLDRKVLQAPILWIESAHALLNGLVIDIELMRAGPYCKRVVDHVRTGLREAHGGLRRIDRIGDRVGDAAIEGHIMRMNIQFGTRKAAVFAVIGTELPVLAIIVGEHT